MHYVVASAGAGAGAGQDHAYQRNWTDESFYVATPGGFTRYRLSEDGLIIEFVCVDGRTQYAHLLTK